MMKNIQTNRSTNMVGLILAAARFGMITESAGASADFRKK